MPTPKVEDTRSSAVANLTYIGNAESVSDFQQYHPNQYDPFTPILDRVLIRRVEEAQTSKLGLPDKFRQQTNKGEILGIGDLVKTNLKPGDRVLFGEYNAERFTKDGEELWLVREADIRGVERLVVFVPTLSKWERIKNLWLGYFHSLLGGF